MKRKTFEDDACPVARSLEAIGDTWSMLIVRQAFAGQRKFGEFQSTLGVAKNILTNRLRKLVTLGVLEQVAPAEGGAHLEYALTKKGRGLYLVLMAIKQWGEGCGGPADYTLVDCRDRKPVKPLAFYSHDGRVLTMEEMELIAAADV
jgi:DNA-binding HxlR family transcriptional regulator